MSADVTILKRALADPRFGVLARALGLADADHARGKLEHVWAWCTLNNRYAVPPAFLSEFLGEHGVDGLVASDLGVRVEGPAFVVVLRHVARGKRPVVESETGMRPGECVEGVELVGDPDGEHDEVTRVRLTVGEVYIRGTAGRVEWLASAKVAGQRGGKKRAENARARKQAEPTDGTTDDGAAARRDLDRGGFQFDRDLEEHAAKVDVLTEAGMPPRDAEDRAPQCRDVADAKRVAAEFKGRRQRS